MPARRGCRSGAWTTSFRPEPGSTLRRSTPKAPSCRSGAACAGLLEESPRPRRHPRIRPFAPRARRRHARGVARRAGAGGLRRLRDRRGDGRLPADDRGRAGRDLLHQRPPAPPRRRGAAPGTGVRVTGATPHSPPPSGARRRGRAREGGDRGRARRGPLHRGRPDRPAARPRRRCSACPCSAATRSLPRLRAEGVAWAFVALGSNAARERIGDQLRAAGFRLATHRPSRAPWSCRAPASARAWSSWPAWW